MKCIVHIGTEKTGSTSLQHWLYENRAYLSSAGVYLSQNLARPSNRLLSLYFQEREDGWTKEHGLNDRLKRREFLEPSMAAFRDEVQRAEVDHSTFLITSEHLHSRLFEQHLVDELYRFLAPLFSSITVVVYVRNQADALLSSYSTSVRAMETRFLSEVAETIGPGMHPYDHLQTAQLWSSAFGRSGLQFRVYDLCADLPTGVIGDFAEHVLGLSAPPGEYKGLNKSLSPFQAAAFRQINARFQRWPAETPSGRMNRKLKQLVSELPVTTRHTLMLPDPRQLLGKFQERNQFFFDEYGDGTNHFAPERWVARLPAQSARFDDEPDLDRLIRSLLEQIRPEEMVPVRASLWSRIQRLKLWNQKP